MGRSLPGNTKPLGREGVWGGGSARRAVRMAAGMCAASAHCFMYLIVNPRRHNGSALTQAAAKGYGCVCPSDEGSEKNGITEI